MIAESKMFLKHAQYNRKGEFSKNESKFLHKPSWLVQLKLEI